MATQNKPVKPVKPLRRPQVVGPFEGVNPPEDVGAPTSPPPPRPANELRVSPEVQRRADEEERLEELRDASGKAAEASRRASMGTSAKEPVKKAKGGMVGSASRRADGCAQRGKTKGRIV